MYQLQIGQSVTVHATSYVGKVVGYNGPRLIDVEVTAKVKGEKVSLTLCVEVDGVTPLS